MTAAGEATVLETPPLVLAVVFFFFLVVTTGFEFVRHGVVRVTSGRLDRSRTRAAALRRATRAARDRGRGSAPARPRTNAGWAAVAF